MRSHRWGRSVAVIIAVLALLAGCGDDGDSETSTDATASTDGTAPESTGSVDLAAAFAETADITHYRVRQSTAQTLSSSALGIDQSTEIDPDNPDVIGEVTPERSHLSIDLGRALGPMAGDIGSLVLEMWLDEERLVIDSTQYASLLEQNPQAQLGPLEPGISYVDLAAVQADSPELVAAITGNGLAAPSAMAERLPAALDDVRQVDDRTITGTASFDVVLEALGGDVEQLAAGAAGGVALNLGVDPKGLARFYADFYRQLPADVTIELDESGSVRAVSSEVDLSGVYDAVFENAEQIGIQLTDDEARQAREAFADTEWTMTSRVAFEEVEGLEVEAAPPTEDDRTEVWLEFLRASGL